MAIIAARSTLAARRPSRQRLSLVASLGLLALVLSAGQPAKADCVGYSKQRAQKDAEALKATPPSLASLGLPDIKGLSIIADKSASDPKCDPHEKRTVFWYKTQLSLQDFYAGVFPYIAPKNNWTSPALSHDFYLSSGTRIILYCNGGCDRKPVDQPGVIEEINVRRLPADKAKPLTDAGPGWNWTALDLAQGRGIPAAGKASAYK